MMVYLNSENKCDVILNFFRLLINFAMHPNYAFFPQIQRFTHIEQDHGGIWHCDQ